MKINPENFSILQGAHLPKEAIRRVLDAALEAADPFSAVERNLGCSSSYLWAGGKTYLLYPDSQIMVVSIGKAALSMAEAAFHRLGNRIDGGVVVCKHNPMELVHLGKMEVVIGSHPVPDERSVIAAKKISNCVGGLSEHDILILLISGGGSALVCLPAEGVTLNDIQAVTSGLLKTGATINEMNAVRKHLDLIKGGGLAKMTSPAQVAALVISDVVNNPLDVIASGPAFPDPTTFDESRQILSKYFTTDDIPDSILNRFEKGSRGEIQETLKIGDDVLERIHHIIIASNFVSAQSAFQAAQQEGFDTELLTYELTGEANAAGVWLAEMLAAKKVQQKPYCGIAGGETTVTISGNGLGGRNLETALSSVRTMNTISNGLLITLATDGEDGPTNAAGAIVSAGTLQRGLEIGFTPEDFLANNDSYRYFENVGGLIITGPSGTNVNDLNFIFKF